MHAGEKVLILEIDQIMKMKWTIWKKREENKIK